MHVEAGKKLPIAEFFSYNWVPVVPSDTPTVTIYRQDSNTGVWDEPVSAASVTVEASGLCHYDYDTDEGDYIYVVKITTTDTTVDQQIIVLPTMMSGGWPNKLLGLMQQNFYLDTTVYDDNNNLTSARVRLYKNSSSVGTANDILATYTLTAVFSDAGIITTYQMVEA